MTNENQLQIEKEAIYAAYTTKKEADGIRSKLFLVGQDLAKLARALQEHPEQITRLPDPYSAYDYSEGVRAIREGEKVIKMCEDLRLIDSNAKAAELRKTMFGL